jgi:hypothetical protein
MFLLLKSEAAILASDCFAGSGQTNVLQRMSKRSAAAIANGHFTLYFNHRNLADQLQSVTPVFA